ncbi:hypothetical protein FHW12_002611 [Dokdonella fugitiva]|uniref:Tetratricopeptide repeat protein n=1 Tax=Dokdonella fugitiva TaxID=328517 RepID=A0A839F4C1_9GAMM|nr:hypothetical protein [Dokdonella fugitiva]MBA8888378.1 hypothetical protein [Dokdonella fugitiva]
MSTIGSRHLGIGAALAALGIACVLAYARGLGGDFLFDDFPNIVANPALQAVKDGRPDWFAVAFLTGSGQLRRPISMLSFGANVYWFGMSPFAFKLVNVVIHLFNGLLLYGLFRRIAPRLLPAGRAVDPRTVALVAAGIWLLHPLHVSSVLYVVQRMNLLATLFVLLGLYSYAEGRTRMLRGERGLLVALSGLCVFGLLAVFCKENGALVAMYALAVEWSCFRFETPGGGGRRLRAFFWLSVALPLVAYAGYLVLHPESLAYARNGFTLYTRLLSEARVLCEYLSWIFVPLPSFMGMYHDDIAVSAGLFAPVTTAIAIAFLVALAAAAWRWRRSVPALALGVAWFLVGHSLESTIFPLELVFEHRNYLPMAGPLLAATCLLAPMLAMRPTTARAAAFGVLALLGIATTARAYDWRSALTLALADVAHHPASSRSQYEAGRAVAADGARRGAFDAVVPQAMEFMRRAADLDPRQVFPRVSQILLRGKSTPTPPEEIGDLAERLRRAESNEQANPFLDMLVTASEGTLALSPADVAKLFEAALANPRWRPQVRAMMYNDYGAYRFNVEGDHAEGIRLTELAATTDPRNAYFELNLAKIAIAVGDMHLAAEHLAKARDIDRLDSHREEIDALQKQIHD